MYVVMSKLQLTVHAELQRYRYVSELRYLDRCRRSIMHIYYRKGIKALLILCPLLGINHVLVLAQPTEPQWLKLVFGYYCVVVSSTQV